MRAWLLRYGYLALFAGVLAENAGVPVPGETMLIAAAGEASRGALSIWAVLVTASAAAVLGDNLGFLVGRYAGGRVAARMLHGRGEKRLAKLQDGFRRFGPAFVLVARFLAGFRVVVALAAGASGMSWPVFLLFNMMGAVLWAGSVGAAAYFGAPIVTHLLVTSRVAQAVAGVTVVVVVCVFLAAQMRNPRWKRLEP